MTRRGKIWMILVTGVVLAVGIVWAVVYWGRARAPFMYAGTLENTKVIISSRVASDVADEYVADGDMVVRGTVLMRLACDAQKILARQLDNDFERVSALAARGHASAAELDIITRSKQDNDLRISWCDITAPINGMVIGKFRNVGEVVAPGTPLFALANPYDIWAYFYVPYDMLHKLFVGQSVRGILPELPDKSFPGRIVKISEVAEFTPKNVQTRSERTRLVYGIKVQFENPNLILKSGMTIESDLQNEK